MTWFVNYTLDSSVSLTDRGFLYGDGVFETIKTIPNIFFQLEDHFSRLYRGLAKLGMPFPEDQKITLHDFMQFTILPLISCESVVKIIITRGEGGRGYLPPNDCCHTIVIGILPAPDYSSEQERGVSLSVSPVTVNTNPFLAGIKHLNRLENVVAKQHLASSDFEAIMLNNNGELIECIQSNIFWFKGNVLYTPSLDKAGVEGTYRQLILENQVNSKVEIGHFTLASLMDADEVFITNSLMQIVPVTNVVDKSFPIGSLTRKLQISMQSKEKHAVS